MMTRRRSLWLLTGLLLAAFALRVYRLDAQSLWWDEGISLHLATSSAAEIVRDRLNNIHPPLYFFLLKGWLALTGVSVFSGRYLSALASLTQVALVYAVVRRASTDFTDDADEERIPSAWSVKSTVALLAAGLMLFSPLSVIYGQEIRVYALLPVAYLAMLWWAHRILSCSPAPLLPRSPASLLLLASLEWFALHLHYIALFAVGYIGLWGTLSLARRQEWAGLRRWLAAHALAAAASLPWLLAVAANWSAIQAEAGAGTFTTDPVPLPYLFAQVWAFHLTGLAGALANPWVRVGAAVAGVAGAALMLMRLDLTGDRTPVRFFTAHWLAPLLPALLVWSVRSFSHPRYVTMFAALFVAVAACLIGPPALGRRPTARLFHRLLVVLFASALVALGLWGLGQYFFNPATAKADMRGVARHLEAVAAPDDLILIPDTDWSLPFEYRGPAPARMPGLDKPPDEVDASLTGLLDCAGDEACAASGRVFVVDYPDGTRDWAARLPFELARRGYRVGATPFEGLFAREYRLTDRSGPLPACDDPGMVRPDARFGPLELTAAWVAQNAPADAAVAVALCWRAVEPPPADLAVSLVLRDPLTGERVAQTDAPLLDRFGAPTHFWPAGAAVVTYHVLPLPPGAPPVTGELLAGIYAGEAGGGALEAVGATGEALGRFAPLGDVALSPPVGLEASAYGLAAPPLWDEPVDAGEGLTLLGARFSPGPYRPGQTVRVGLTWQATAGGLSDLRPTLALEQGGAVVAESGGAAVHGRYPTDRWAAGQMVSEFRDVRVPAGVSGPATLALFVEGRRLPLGEVTVEGTAVQFEPPPMAETVAAQFGESIRLAGYDPPAAIRAPDEVSLTLYWQALAGDIPTSYTVFVHLLAEDGRIVAQHDAPPANGARPTHEWLAGEFITDPHTLVWREPDFAGRARLVVGLYDPATGERLLTTDGRDAVELLVGPQGRP
jgi:uncharacterized membrane protein